MIRTKTQILHKISKIKKKTNKTKEAYNSHKYISENWENVCADITVIIFEIDFLSN